MGAAGELADLPDLVIVDADQGWDDLAALAGQARRLPPSVALLGSEAPGRIAWALEQGASAIIRQTGRRLRRLSGAGHGACRSIRNAEAVAERLQYLEERVRLRPLVHAAVEKLMRGARPRRGTCLCDPARLRHAPPAADGADRRLHPRRGRALPEAG